MRNTRLICFALLVSAGLGSCSKEIWQPEDIRQLAMETKEFNITASTEMEPEVKTVLADNFTTVLWRPEDEIKVFSGGSSSKFVSVNPENAAIADFKGSIDIEIGSESDWIYGIYPYQENSVLSEKGQISAYLPMRQTAVAGTFADDLFISVARSHSRNLAFYNACSGLRFSFAEDGFTSLTLTADNVLAGSMLISFDDAGIPSVAYSNASDGRSITVEAPVGGTFQPGIWYYLVCRPGSLPKGLTISVLDRNGYVRYLDINTPVVFERSRFKQVEHLDQHLSPVQEPTNTITYTSSDGKIVSPYVRNAFGSAHLVYNRYENGVGTFGFDRPVVSIEDLAFEGAPLTSIALDENIGVGEYAFARTALTGTVHVACFEPSAFWGTSVSEIWCHSSNRDAYYGFDLTLSSISSAEDALKCIRIEDSVYADLCAATGETGYRLARLMEYYNDLMGLDNPDESAIWDEMGDVVAYAASLVSPYYDELTRLLNSCLDLICERNIEDSFSLIDIMVRRCEELSHIIDDVVAPLSADISVNRIFITSPVLLYAGQTGVMPVEIEPRKAYDSVLNWSSSDPAIVTVDSEGCVFGVKKGEATITVTDQKTGKSASKPVLVLDPAPEWVDMGLSVDWASWNLGSDSPWGYGDYYAWGETEPDTIGVNVQYKWYDPNTYQITKYNSADGKTELDEEDDVAHMKLGDGCRIPTDAEWQELIDNCSVTSDYLCGGNAGSLLTSRLNGNHLFLPVGGRYDAYRIGNSGYFWSSERVKNDQLHAYAFTVSKPSGGKIESITRYSCLSVRPVRNKD